MRTSIKRKKSPRDELTNFTNRVHEIELVEGLVERTELRLPVVMFYGVGGNGKTWLSRRLREKIEERDIPTAAINLDAREGGGTYLNDSISALAAIRRQFEDTPCPRFDLGYAWLQHRRGVTKEPQFRGSGGALNAWELLRESGTALADDIPGKNIATWLFEKLGGPVWERVKKTATVRWLLSQAGQDEYLRLAHMDAAALEVEAAHEANGWLLEDLNEHLPQRDAACRGVVFVDTFEAIRKAQPNDEQTRNAEAWVREFYAPDSRVLLIITGRDELTWGEQDPLWHDKNHLDQQRVGPLSKPDAMRFLANCGIADEALQAEVLRVCTVKQAQDSIGYHPFALGLCADTIANADQDNNTESFRIAPGDYAALATRFLNTLPERAYSTWIRELALTPHFDETAARAAFGEGQRAPGSAAWQFLRSLSFVLESESDDTWSLHSLMRESLSVTADDAGTVQGHGWWAAHWEARSESETDGAAELAWFHRHRLQPEQATGRWAALARSSRDAGAMDRHARLLGWWAHVGVDAWFGQGYALTEDQVGSVNALAGELSFAALGDIRARCERAIGLCRQMLSRDLRAERPLYWATAQNNLGIALCSVGERESDTARLGQAVAAYEAALQERTRDRVPLDWAMTQNNLGNALQRLGERESDTARLGQAVAAYEAALQELTSERVPLDWATTQNNLGNALQRLGERESDTARLGQAVAAYEAALQERTRDRVPLDWAMTQNNLGNALQSLGERESDTARLGQAVAAYEAALQERTRDRVPLDWAMTQNNLGNALQSLGERESDTARLGQAVAAYEAALQERTRDRVPLDWAKTQNNLGNALRSLGERESDTARLGQAVAAYEAALQERTRDRVPLDWAKTQNNLGNALQSLGERESDTARLGQAVAAYEAALQELTSERVPLDWATTQNNLGNALQRLGERESDTARLGQAVAAYEAALQERTRDRVPLDWAKTQNNLGNALRSLGERESDTARLGQAVAAYEAALQELTSERVPLGCATAQNNLGNALRTWGERENDTARLKQAVEAVSIALSICEAAGHPAADSIRTYLEETRGLLAECRGEGGISRVGRTSE